LEKIFRKPLGGVNFFDSLYVNTVCHRGLRSSSFAVLSTVLECDLAVGSVRLSVTHWYWVKTNNSRITQFYHRVAQVLITTLMA